MAGRVAERRQPDDRRRQHAGRSRSTGSSPLEVTALVCFPLLAEERLIGTLAFGSRRRSRFTVEELAMLQLVADQIAIALEREKLIERAAGCATPSWPRPIGARTSSSPCWRTSCAIRWRRSSTRLHVVGLDAADARRQHRARARDDGSAGAPSHPARRRSARRLAHHAGQDRAAPRAHRRCRRSSSRRWPSPSRCSKRGKHTLTVQLPPEPIPVERRR